MIPTEHLLAASMVFALVLYLLGAGADFGGGVWDLLAHGPRRREQRALIEQAIGPIWEANHVWLILVVVILFAGFPKAFFAISIALHVPLTLLLLGIVFRGSAFAFRGMEPKEERGQAVPDARHRWGLVFSIASLVSPILLGINVGAIASGTIRVAAGEVATDFVRGWLAPFPIVIGVFCLTLCGFLAATYLAFEARNNPPLADDFRLRALFSGVAVGLLAMVAFALSAKAAPEIREGLTQHAWAWPLHVGTGAAALGAFWTLWRRKFGLARVCVGAQTTFILLGWAGSQYPYLVVPDITVVSAAANAKTQAVLLIALAVGSIVLFPSLFVLFRIFKR